MRLPSFRKKPKKLVAAEKIPVNKNNARDSTPEAQPADSWDWSSGKSKDEADKLSKVGVIR